MSLWILILALVACSSTTQSPDAEAATADPPTDRVVIDRVESDAATFRVVEVASGLEHPWGATWLPDGRALITERPGRLQLLENGSLTAVSGLPSIAAKGQGGLLDIAAHPNYDETGWIYFTYSAEVDGRYGTVLARARLDGTALVDVEELFRQSPFVESGVHFGSRIVFTEDDLMYVTLGERGQRQANGPGAQDSTNTIGTTIRLTLDGGIPPDNPFVGRSDVPDAVYTYGHRNQQGMAIHPATGHVWQHEHGPHGGDELNLITAGTNYGWPAITYGDEYSDQSPIGGTEAPGMRQPVTYWDPSPALSGMDFYTGSDFAEWENDLFMGALAHQKIMRLELESGPNGASVTEEEILLEGELGRIRAVEMAPDGHLYLLSDMPNGSLYRIEPVG